MENRKITVIGLCGRSGSGKGYVSDRFFEYGIPSVDTDRIYHQLLEPVGGEPSPCLFELSEFFGPEIAGDDMRLDRRALSVKVFGKGNEEKLKKLNGITHKYILEETLKLIEKYEREGKRAVLIDAPVLFESGFDSLCHITICVTAPDDICVERICSRDGRSKKEAENRLSSQKSPEELRELCSFEIVNDGVCDTEKQILSFIKKFIPEVPCEKE